MNTNSLNLKMKKILGKRIKKIIFFLLFPQRNHFKLFNYTDRAKNNHVNLNYWWESNNLGDTLSPIIVNHMLSQRGLDSNVVVSSRRHLYAVGSVLTAGIQDCTVWGSGILNAGLIYRLSRRRFDVRAVRGPLTRAILMDYGHIVPEVYGDPAILMVEIYNPVNIEKKHKFGLIMHKDQILDIPKDLDIYPIDICTDDYRKFIDELKKVEIVISSSLHGIILAESFGIEAILLKPKIDILKYYDWYYSTRRFDFPMAETIKKATLISPVALPTNLDVLRKKLKNAFPYDIYKD